MRNKRLIILPSRDSIKYKRTRIRYLKSESLPEIRKWILQIRGRRKRIQKGEKSPTDAISISSWLPCTAGLSFCALKMGKYKKNKSENK